MQRFYSGLLGDARGDVAAALQGAMRSMIHDHRFSVMEWAAFVCYGLPLPAQAGPEESTDQLKVELEDVIATLHLTEKKHTRPMPHVLQAALTWFSDQGYASIDEMLRANAPFTTIGVSKSGPFKITAAGENFQLVEALALKNGPARILLKNFDLRRKSTQE